MEERYFKDIESFAEENEESIFRDISRLVAVNSVIGDSEADAPFGKGPRSALELGLKIAGELGLDGVNCENMIGYAGLGKGDRYLATITHLDTVPTGDGWSHDPYKMIERDGFIVGRGVMDDKGPSVLCLYALKYLKERNVPLRYPVRALLGINEENEMKDVRYYLQNYPAPLFCFSPDANFPLCNGEKGIFHGLLTSKYGLENICDIKGGFAENAVPDKAEAWVKADDLKGSDSVDAELQNGMWHLTAHGLGGHACAPAGTVNAIGVLVDYILKNGVAGENEKSFLSVLSLLHSSTDGSSLGIAATDDYFEPLTIIGGMIGVEGGKIYQTVDCRYPTSMNGSRIASALQEAAGETAEVTVGHDSPPFYMALDNPAVQVCLKAYRLVTGDYAEPYTIGGGTYAREFPNAVSFGPEHPERPFPVWAGPIHGVDEAACKAYFVEALKVYIAALIELEKLDF